MVLSAITLLIMKNDDLEVVKNNFTQILEPFVEEMIKEGRTTVELKSLLNFVGDIFE